MAAGCKAIFASDTRATHEGRASRSEVWRARGLPSCPPIVGSLTASLRTKILDFRGFDSSIILFLRGAIPSPIGKFPESLSQAVLAGIMLVGRLGVRLIRDSHRWGDRLIRKTDSKHRHHPEGVVYRSLGLNSSTVAVKSHFQEVVVCRRISLPRDSHRWRDRLMHSPAGPRPCSSLRR